MEVSGHEFSFKELKCSYLNRIISVQRAQPVPHYQTKITLGFNNFAIDSFINEIYSMALIQVTPFIIHSNISPFLISLHPPPNSVS